MECVFVPFEALEPADRQIFAIILFTEAVFVLAINGFVIYVMWSRGMHKKFGFKILFLVSVLQILYAIFCLILFAVTMLTGETPNCTHRRIFYTPSLVISYIVNTTTAFLALDRYLRVHFMKILSGKIEITKTQYYIIYVVYIFISVVQGVMTGFGSAIFENGQLVRLCLATVDALFILLSIFLYCLSILKLREHQRNSRHLSSTDRDITRLTKIYFLTFIICFVPYAVCYFNSILGTSRRIRSIVVLSSYVMMSCSGIVNGVVFMKYAAKGRNSRDLCKNCDD